MPPPIRPRARPLAPPLWATAWTLVAFLLVPAESAGHGAFHDRIKELLPALERQPREARLHFALAELFCQHGDWQLALASADTADELSPGAYPTDLLRGEAQLGAGRPEKARAALDRHLAAHPGSARAFVLRARALVATQGAEAALPDFRAALRAPAQREPDHAREAAAALAQTGHRAEAADALAAAIAEFGPDPALLLAALEHETATQRWSAALSRIDALQLSAPRPEPWMARRAQLLLLAGRPAEARAAWAALLAHIDALPNLERGMAAIAPLADQARRALAQPPP